MAADGQTFNMNVGTVGLALPDDQANVDGETSISLPMTTTNAGSGTLSYSATGLPLGLTINSTSGVIGGLISASDDADSPYAVTVTVGDCTYTTSQTFNWNIGGVSLDNPGDQSNVEDSSVSLSLTGYDYVGTPTYSATGLPSGAKKRGHSAFSWPQAGSVGS
jgi:hypothetical protein